MQNSKLDIFDSNTTIDINEKFLIKPIIEEFIDQEALLYEHNCRTSGVKEQFPEFYAADQLEAKERLLHFIGKAKKRESILYCIRFKDFLAPIGYIYLGAPQNKNDNWQAKVWVNGSMQKKGIMSNALKSLVPLLHNFDISCLEYSVPRLHDSGQKIFEKIGFKLVNQDNGMNNYHYTVE
ncbi:MULTISPECIES: GNAT family N-acetyltransferase [Myroides]|uniref:GNAT family N-acetyltransferase n=1 Tax=Myroides albus TaxID=2562892 RepID=A0A6I3LGS8_9FLAO|nr:MULTISPECIES: GNAT family protein [Myroides]MTG98769.1 GNAT family N-acetyltransferase [Myroides albus]MVX35898.1 GNAT family N-acetyltransferase [Myroides sp. LoEW2-1]UVD79914.1 GNAT family N-acetyltransferase [Myroides albus]